MEAMRKNSMNFGIVLGLMLIVLTIIMYAINVNLLTSMIYGVITFIIITGFGSFSAISFKKNNGGFMSFKEAFICFFITFIIGFFILTLFTIVLLNFIDTETKEIVTENVIKLSVEMSQKMGAKPSQINDSIERVRKSDPYGIFGQLKGMLGNIVIYSIIGLITALIVRRERPQSI